MFTRIGQLGVLACGTLLVGCAHGPHVTARERSAIYESAGIQFERTVLIKPADSDRPEFKVAPLLIQEVKSEEDVAQAPYTVYFWRTYARVAGEVWVQFNYLWFHATPGAASKVPQGVRITFDQNEVPVVWEVLRSPTGARVLYVSASLEAAAMARYAAPADGRRYWVERPVNDDPTVVVARILDDGPTTMGPIVYLESVSHDIATLICRCMEAQAREVVGLREYRLSGLDDAAVRWLGRMRSRQLTRWLPGRPADDLTRWLRLETP